MTGARLMNRLAGLNRLFAAIQQATDDGELVPCTVNERASLWLSDDPDEQVAAAHGCQGCPALTACRAYATAWPEPAGVWAGRVGKREVVTS